MNRKSTLAAAACALALWLASPAGAMPQPIRTQPWPEEVLDAASRIAVQEGGRIKPLSTLAAFDLLRLNGKRSLEVVVTVEPDGTFVTEKLSPTAWLLDCLFFPHQAVRYETFLVEDSDVLDTIGLDHAGKKRRDHYSFAHLIGGYDRLATLAERYSRLDANDLSPLQRHVMHLHENLVLHHRLVTMLDFARSSYDVSALADRFDGRATAGALEIAAFMPELLADLDAGRNAAAGTPERQRSADVQALLVELLGDAEGWTAIRMIPPPGPVHERGVDEWLTPGHVIDACRGGLEPIRPALDALVGLGSLVHLAGDRDAIAAGMTDLSALLEGQAVARGEYDKIDLEVSFYRADWFFKAQWLNVLAFLAAAILWLKPRARVPYVATWTLAGVAWVLLAIGITIRCVLRSRPPVSTLYESILFITAVAGFAAMVAEAINRRRIALTLATVLGSVGLFLAAWYEDHGRVDTMPTLQAVLDTNFWLSTHVTTITMGYAAGFLAAALGHVWVLGKLFRLKRDDPGFYRSVARMTYGAVCFGLFFSTIGTILGGVWANDSWGRFWGWDPKENGALMIVLANLAILHGRLGGFLREAGLQLAAIFLGTIVAFSWFHTNLLGVGLHAYGFDSSLKTLVWTFYRVEWTVLAVGIGAMLLARRSTASASRPAEARGVPALEE